jgi:hypothetical protein
MMIAHQIGQEYRMHMKEFQTWPKDINSWVI